MSEEDLLHIQTASFLRGLEDANQLRDVISWSYMPFGELRSKSTGALLKKKGTKKGVPDFWIRKKIVYNKLIDNRSNIYLVYNLYLEAKTIKGKQSLEQKEFEGSCCRANERYYIYRSLDELIEILKQEGIYEQKI